MIHEFDNLDKVLLSITGVSTVGGMVQDCQSIITVGSQAVSMIVGGIFIVKFVIHLINRNKRKL